MQGFLFSGPDWKDDNTTLPWSYEDAITWVIDAWGRRDKNVYQSSTSDAKEHMVRYARHNAVQLSANDLLTRDLIAGEI